MELKSIIAHDLTPTLRLNHLRRLQYAFLHIRMEELDKISTLHDFKGRVVLSNNMKGFLCSIPLIIRFALWLSSM